MLSECEESIVARGLSSSDHDFFSRAATAGEPFLRDGLLCYFDGMRVEIIGVPFSAVSDADLRVRVSGVVDDWRESSDARVIDYFGPVSVDLPASGPWQCPCSDEPFESNVDVFIDLTQPVVDRTKVKQDVRRARRRGIQTVVQPRSMLGHEHITLLGALFRRGDFNLEDAGHLTSVVSILRHPATLAFEAKLDSRLVGFVIVHRYFADTPFAVCAAFERGCRGVSDALYAAILEHYQTGGARRLGLGYATGPALLAYKAKWGTPILGRPFYQRTWARIPLPDCDHWPWRLQQIAQEPTWLDTA